MRSAKKSNYVERKELEQWENRYEELRKDYLLKKEQYESLERSNQHLIDKSSTQAESVGDLNAEIERINTEHDRSKIRINELVDELEKLKVKKDLVNTVYNYNVYMNELKSLLLKFNEFSSQFSFDKVWIWRERRLVFDYIIGKSNLAIDVYKVEQIWIIEAFAREKESQKYLDRIFLNNGIHSYPFKNSNEETGNKWVFVLGQINDNDNIYDTIKSIVKEFESNLPMNKSLGFQE